MTTTERVLVGELIDRLTTELARLDALLPTFERYLESCQRMNDARDKLSDQRYVIQQAEIAALRDIVDMLIARLAPRP